MYALFYSGFDPVVIGLFVYGSLMLLLYTYPLKYFALGELTIFLIWGPIMIGGVYVVLAHQWSWAVALAGIPFGLSTASINIGKHIDKSEEDRARRGCTRCPCSSAQTAARWVNFMAIVLAYAVTLYAIFVTRFLTPVLLIVLIAAPQALKALGAALEAPPDGGASRVPHLAPLVLRGLLLPQPQVREPFHPRRGLGHRRAAGLSGVLEVGRATR